MGISARALVGDTGKRERVDNDYYATPPEVTLQFLNEIQKDGINIEGTILEPACGEGHMSNVLIDKFGEEFVTSADLIDRNYELMAESKDFLTDEFDRYDNVITNPPFKYAQEFIEKALEISDDKVIMFAKIQLLEGKGRKKLFDINPPNYIYVHSSRVNPYRNGSPTDENGKKWSSTMCFAWFIWEKNNTNEPIIRWLD